METPLRDTFNNKNRSIKSVRLPCKQQTEMSIILTTCAALALLAGKAAADCPSRTGPEPVCAWGTSICAECSQKCVPNPNYVLPDASTPADSALSEEVSPEETALYVCYAIGIFANNPTLLEPSSRRRALQQLRDITAPGAHSRGLLQQLSDLPCPSDLSAFDQEFVSDVNEGRADAPFSTLPEMEAYLTQYCGTAEVRTDSDVTALIFLNAIAASKNVPTEEIDVRIGTNICTQVDLFQESSARFERHNAAVAAQAEFNEAYNAAYADTCAPTLERPEVASLAACLGPQSNDAAFLDAGCTRALVQAYGLEASLGDRWADAMQQYVDICATRTGEVQCENVDRNGELDGVITALQEVEAARNDAYLEAGDRSAAAGAAATALFAALAVAALAVM